MGFEEKIAELLRLRERGLLTQEEFDGLVKRVREDGTGGQVTLPPPASDPISVVNNIEPSKGVGFAEVLGGIGLVIGVVTNIALFQQGGRVGLLSLGFYPVIGFVLGAWIDGKRGKS